MPDDVNLRLRPHVSVIAHSPDEVELRYGVWNPVSYSVSDAAHEGNLARLVSRLDGSLPPSRLAAAEGVPREQVERLIDHLLQLGLLERGPSNALDAYLATAAPWRADEVKPGQRVLILDPAPPDEVGALGERARALLADTLTDNPVELVGPADPAAQVLADPDTSWLNDGLATEERLEAFAGWRDSVVVAPQRVVDPIRMRVLNRACLRHRVRWLHAAVDGPFLFVGPAFLPYQSPCYECLEQRILLNLREGASYQRYKQALAQAQVRLGAPPLAAPIAGVLTSHLAMEALNLVLTGSTFTVGRMLSVHLPTMEFSYPEVLRMPGCAGCGSVPERDGEALYYDLAVAADRDGGA